MLPWTVRSAPASATFCRFDVTAVRAPLAAYVAAAWARVRISQSIGQATTLLDTIIYRYFAIAWTLVFFASVKNVRRWRRSVAQNWAAQGNGLPRRADAKQESGYYRVRCSYASHYHISTQEMAAVSPAKKKHNGLVNQTVRGNNKHCTSPSKHVRQLEKPITINNLANTAPINAGIEIDSLSKLHSIRLSCYNI